MLLFRSETLLLATATMTTAFAAASADAEASSSLSSGGRRLRGAGRQTGESAATNNYTCGSFYNDAPIFYCEHPCQNIGDECLWGLECLYVGPDACPSPPTAVGTSRSTNNGGNGGEEEEGNKEATSVAAAYMESGYFVQNVHFYDDHGGGFFDAYEDLVRTRVSNELGILSGVSVDSFEIVGISSIPDPGWIECEDVEALPQLSMSALSMSSENHLVKSAHRINSHQICTRYNSGSTICFGYYVTFVAPSAPSSEPDNDEDDTSGANTYADLFLKHNRGNVTSWMDELANARGIPVNTLDVLDTEGWCERYRRFL